MSTTNIEVRATVPKSARLTALDWTFSRMFRGLIYNQVWEDPLVDFQALALGSDHKMVMIGSAGCNALAYLSADVKRIDAVDINAAHRALFTLKRSALERLPDRAAFFRFFGVGRSTENVLAYDSQLASHLPDSERAYWSGRNMTGERRINMFRTGFYNRGLLQRFIGLTHILAKWSGCNPKLLIAATNMEEQRRLFASEVAPVFSTRFSRAFARSHLSLFALGIPPAQYSRLEEGADNNLSGLLIKRIEHLACNFPIAENPFAWQVFARRYGPEDSKAIPFYLESQTYDAIQPRAGRVNLHAIPITNYLAAQSSGSIHRFVLLDAQDWMSPDDVAALWREIGRTAHPEDARVLFRTAGPSNPFHCLPEDLRRKWSARDDLTPAFTAAERSALYSGVHLIER
jgi:S-adenosylmethionine-diacylglycerol 3-amino-3-carboxypropyl transferase